MDRLKGVEIEEAENSIALADAEQRCGVRIEMVTRLDVHLRRQLKFLLLLQQIPALDDPLLKRSHQDFVLLNGNVLLLLAYLEPLLLLELGKLQLFLCSLRTIVGVLPDEQVAILADGEQPLVILTEERADDSAIVARESKREEVLQLVETDHLQSQVVRPGDDEAAVIGPCDASDVARVKIAIFFVDDQRGKNFLRHIWRLKHSELCAFDCDGEEFSVGAELARGDLPVEVEASDDDLLLEIDK